MKRFIKIFFIFVTLFLLLNTNTQQLSNRISNSDFLNHFISQSNQPIEKITVQIDNNENYLAKSNSYQETIIASRKQNEQGFNFSNDISPKLKDNYRIFYKDYKKLLYISPYNISSYLRNNICTRAP